MTQPGRLVVICGLPGSGKTTLARELEQSMPAVRFCPDDWMRALEVDIWDIDLRFRLEATMWEMQQQLLRLGVNVINENGSWAREERDLLREGARAIGAPVELHYLEAPLDELYRRVTARGGIDPPMTRAHFDEWSATIERPTAEELALFDAPVTP